MKQYYQYENRGFKLPKPIYMKTVNTIRAYDFYKKVAGMKEDKSITSLPVDKIASNVVAAESYMESIQTALKGYVSEEYQEAVFLHLVKGIEYEDLEAIYGISVSTLKRWNQRFVFGVATELGDNYFED